MKVFISGSISIKQLPQAAIEKIDNIIKKEYSILLGDAGGVDSKVQEYLYSNNYRNVTIYYTGERIRNNIGNWNTRNIENNCNLRGRAFYTLKDIEMAKDADYGLMIWDGKSKGTFNNIKKMKTENKRFYVIVKEDIFSDRETDKIKMPAFA